MIYASLQRLPGAPGGIKGNQLKWIQRAVHWKWGERCLGMWKRGICWISLKDLRWALREDNKEKLFVHKIRLTLTEN